MKPPPPPPSVPSSSSKPSDPMHSLPPPPPSQIESTNSYQYVSQPIQSAPPSPCHSNQLTNQKQQQQQQQISTKTTKSSRFKFNTDIQQTPIQLNKIHTKAAQSITTFRVRLNEIDRKIAQWNANFAKEVVDRDKILSDMLVSACVDPLERSCEKFYERLEREFGGLWGDRSESGSNCNSRNSNDTQNIDQENNKEDTEDEIILTITPPLQQPNIKSNNRPSIKTLSNDLSTLSSNLYNHIHTDVPLSMKDNILGLKNIHQSQTPARMQLESLHAKKCEHAIQQKFESMSGLTSKSLAEEQAIRYAELELLRDKILKAGGWDELRTSRFLKEIEEIRCILDNERKERERMDDAVLDQIVETREMLQRTMLDTLTEGV